MNKSSHPTFAVRRVASGLLSFALSPLSPLSPLSLQSAIASTAVDIGSRSSQGSLLTYFDRELITIPITRALGMGFGLALERPNANLIPFVSATLAFGNSFSSLDVTTFGLGSRFYFFRSPIGLRFSQIPVLVSTKRSLEFFGSAGINYTQVKIGFVDADGILQKIQSNVGGLELGVGLDWLPGFLSGSPGGFRYADDTRLTLRPALSYNFSPLSLDGAPANFGSANFSMGISYSL